MTLIDLSKYLSFSWLKKSNLWCGVLRYFTACWGVQQYILHIFPSSLCHLSKIPFCWGWWLCFYLSKLRSIIMQQYFWFTQDRDHVQVSFFLSQHLLPYFQHSHNMNTLNKHQFLTNIAHFGIDINRCRICAHLQINQSNKFRLNKIRQILLNYKRKQTKRV